MPATAGGYVFTLPLANTFPNVLSLGIATLYFKSLGYSNEFIGYIGVLFLPFGVSFLWAPWLDTIGTKRNWTLALGALLVAAFVALAAITAVQPASAWPMLTAISAIALLGATFEVSLNGFLLHALDSRQQAAVAGYRLAAMRGGQILAGGLLVKLCADLGVRTGNLNHGWIALFLILAFLLAALTAYHAWALPRPATDQPALVARGATFRQAWQEIRSLPCFGTLVAFYLLYRFGEGLIARMIPSFLVDPPAAGGLGFPVGDVAVIQGFCGGVAMVAGGILGGRLLQRFGFRRLMLAFAIAMPVTHLGYLLLATQPAVAAWRVDIVLPWISGSAARVGSFHPVVQACVALQTFGYGLGFASMFAMTMIIAQGPFRTTIAAVFVALWSTGWLLPTLLSGVIQQATGYFSFFVVTMLAAVPGILLVPFLPLRLLDDRAPPGIKAR